MLSQVYHSTNGDKNVYIDDILDALMKAITNQSTGGARELPDMLATTGGNPHTSIEIVSRDGVDFKVYNKIEIVAPNIVEYQGQKLTHMDDWVRVMSEIARNNRWPAPGRNPPTVK